MSRRKADITIFRVENTGSRYFYLISVQGVGYERNTKFLFPKDWSIPSHWSSQGRENFIKIVKPGKVVRIGYDKDSLILSKIVTETDSYEIENEDSSTEEKQEVSRLLTSRVDSLPVTKEPRNPTLTQLNNSLTRPVQQSSIMQVPTISISVAINGTTYAKTLPSDKDTNQLVLNFLQKLDQVSHDDVYAEMSKRIPKPDG